MYILELRLETGFVGLASARGARTHTHIQSLHGVLGEAEEQLTDGIRHACLLCFADAGVICRSRRRG